MQCRPSSTVNDGHIHPHIIHWLVSLWWHELGIIAVVFSVFQTRRWWANIWQQTPDILDNPPSITQRINFMFYLVLPETSNQPMNSSLSVHWGYRVRISGLFFLLAHYTSTKVTPCWPVHAWTWPSFIVYLSLKAEIIKYVIALEFSLSLNYHWIFKGKICLPDVCRRLASFPINCRHLAQMFSY